MRFRDAATGLGFAEGPVWCRDGHCVITSVSHAVIYEFDIRADGPAGETTAHMIGGEPNACTEGPGGLIWIAQAGSRTLPTRGPELRAPWSGATGGIQFLERTTGNIGYLSADPVAPNDLCFGPDGLLYVTDPTRRQEKNDGRIWRMDTTSGEAELLCSVPWFPNGIGFGRDGALYVASTGEARIVRYDVTSAGLGPAETFLRMDRGKPDGFAFDVEGNLIIGAPSFDAGPGSVQVWDAAGHLVEVVVPAEDHRFTNVALDGHRLVVCAADSGRALLCEDWPTAGLLLYPFRSEQV